MFTHNITFHGGRILMVANAKCLCHDLPRARERRGAPVRQPLPRDDTQPAGGEQ